VALLVSSEFRESKWENDNILVPSKLCTLTGLLLLGVRGWAAWLVLGNPGHGHHGDERCQSQTKLAIATAWAVGPRSANYADPRGSRSGALGSDSDLMSEQGFRACSPLNSDASIDALARPYVIVHACTAEMIDRCSIMLLYLNQQVVNRAPMIDEVMITKKKKGKTL
jgi:hypothetical protein